MSAAARPIPPSLVLLALVIIGGLGFWSGFRDSYFGAYGIRNCGVAPTATGADGQPATLATPLTTPIMAAPPAEEVKPVEPPKKKAETPKPVDPGTETHDLAPVPKTQAKPADLAPETPTPAKPPTEEAPPPEDPPY